MAMCVIALASVAPCQCFLPGGQEITSPGRISSFDSPQHCVHPRPEMMINVWPQGCVCHAERAPGSKVTLAPPNSPPPGAWNSGSIRTLPVKLSGEPLTEGCDPFRL